MIRSMTGYARDELVTDRGTLTWEMRTVNHRYLEMHFRLPEEFRAIEPRFRGRISARLGRGKVDVNLRFKPSDQLITDIQINEKLIRSLVGAGEKISSISGSQRGLSVTDLLRWPGVVAETEHDSAPIHAAAEELLDRTITQLAQARLDEGRRIEELLSSRCEKILSLVAQIGKRLPDVEARLLEKLKVRIATIAAKVDPDRLEQELVLLSQKMDVAEELERIESHVKAVKEAFARDEPVGRRLDFLMQEFNREANTLASKSQDPDTSGSAVEMKVLIEQMREQVQNVE